MQNTASHSAGVYRTTLCHPRAPACASACSFATESTCGAQEGQDASIGFTQLGWGAVGMTADRSTSPETDDFYDCGSKPASAEMSSADTSPTESQRPESHRMAIPTIVYRDDESSSPDALSTSPDEIAYAQMGWTSAARPSVHTAGVNNVRLRSESDDSARLETIAEVLRGATATGAAEAAHSTL